MIYKNQPDTLFRKIGHALGKIMLLLFGDTEPDFADLDALSERILKERIYDLYEKNPPSASFARRSSYAERLRPKLSSQTEDSTSISSDLTPFHIWCSQYVSQNTELEKTSSMNVVQLDTLKMVS